MNICIIYWIAVGWIFFNGIVSLSCFLYETSNLSGALNAIILFLITLGLLRKKSLAYHIGIIHVSIIFIVNLLMIIATLAAEKISMQVAWLFFILIGSGFVIIALTRDLIRKMFPKVSFRNKLFMLTVYFLVIIGGAFLHISLVRRERIEKYEVPIEKFKQGDRLVREEKFNEALRAYESVLEVDPDNISAQENIQVIKDRLELANDNIRLREYGGLFNKGRLSEARAVLETMTNSVLKSSLLPAQEHAEEKMNPRARKSGKSVIAPR